MDAQAEMDADDAKMNAEDPYHAIKSMSTPEKLAVVRQLEADEPGLFTFDNQTRRMVWVGVLSLFAVAILCAVGLIGYSWSVDITTSTGAGTDAISSTIHPDMTAAWAIIAAVVAGLVGILVPSPNAK